MFRSLPKKDSQVHTATLIPSLSSIKISSRKKTARGYSYLFSSEESLKPFQFPTQCTGSQHSSIRIFQFRYHKFCLTLINSQDIIIDSFLDRFEDIITGLSQSTEQNNCLRAGESDKICKRLT